MYKVTLSLPCYGRPQRTKRAIECILSQDLEGWEALVVGDHCPKFQHLIDSGWLEERAKIASSKGNSLVYYNLPDRTGHCGYQITNDNIKAAQGEYILFMGNDDIILPTHFSHYYGEISKTDLDYMFFNSYIHPLKRVRETKWAPSEIGHSEIIVRASLAKNAPQHSKRYGHEWDVLRYMEKHGKGAKSESLLTTYHVRNIPNGGTKDKID